MILGAPANSRQLGARWDLRIDPGRPIAFGGDGAHFATAFLPFQPGLDRDLGIQRGRLAVRCFRFPRFSWVPGELCMQQLGGQATQTILLLFSTPCLRTGHRPYLRKSFMGKRWGATLKFVA
jgi:hypothetical protein